MYYYYFDKYTDQHVRHAIHTNECPFLAHPQDRALIGFEFSYYSAITHAKKIYPLKSFMVVTTVVVQVTSNNFFPFHFLEKELHISESICANLINRIIDKYSSSFMDIYF